MTNIYDLKSTSRKQRVIEKLLKQEQKEIIECTFAPKKNISSTPQVIKSPSTDKVIGDYIDGNFVAFALNDSDTDKTLKTSFLSSPITSSTHNSPIAATSISVNPRAAVAMRDNLGAVARKMHADTVMSSYWSMIDVMI